MPRPTAETLGSLSMWILIALAGGDQHGYALIQEIERQSGGDFSPGTGTFYAALHRLLADRLIVESPDLPRPDEDQRRRYYRLTRHGRETVAKEAARLERMLQVARSQRLIPPLAPARGGRR